MYETGCSGLVHWDNPEGWDGMGWEGRWEGGSGWETHVHPWRIQVNVWQNQYNIVKLKKRTWKFWKSDLLLSQKPVSLGSGTNLFPNDKSNWQTQSQPLSSI